MKHLMKSFLVVAATAAVLALPARRAAAQNTIDGLKPVAVVSVAQFDELTADVSYLMQAAKLQPFAQQMFMAMATEFTKGVDTKRPGGAYVTLANNEPTVVAFIPVTDLDMVLSSLEQQIGEPRDVGDGILEINSDKEKSAYVKSQGGWAFLAQDPDHLTGLPPDPAAVLGQLPQTYDVAVQLNVQNIPQELRQMAISEMKTAFERGLAENADDDEDAELARKLSANSMNQFVTMIEEAEQVVIGWAVDAGAKNTFIDFRVTAVEGSDFAAQMELLKDSPSNFSGFDVPGAAFAANFASTMPQRDIDQALATLEMVKTKALAAIDEDDDLPSDEARAAVKDVLAQFFDVATSTIETGKADGGAALMLEQDRLNFAAGLFVADGKALDAAFRKLVELAQHQPDFPSVSFDAAEHGGVAFHTMKVPVKEEDAQKVLGEELDVVLGTGAQSAYFAFGEGSIDLLKQVIDKSTSEADRTIPPLQLKLALTPIVEFASYVDENPTALMLSQALKEAGGKDRILVSAKSIARGVNYRLEVEEGVIQALGKLGQMAGAGQGGGF